MSLRLHHGALLEHNHCGYHGQAPLKGSVLIFLSVLSLISINLLRPSRKQ